MKKHFLTAILAGGFTFVTLAQINPATSNGQMVAFADNQRKLEAAVDDNPYATSRQPEFPIGIEGLHSFLASKLQYPASAREKGIAGTVIVQATVDRDGSLRNFRVIDTPDPLLNPAAINAVKALPNWKPALEKGMPVAAEVKVPVRFRLR